MVIGFTSGCFDLIHYGHVVYLNSCKKLCDKLIVGVDSDHMVMEAKGHDRPVIPEGERLAMVKSLKPVDDVCIVSSLSDLRPLSILYDVDKVFKHEGFVKIWPVFGVDGTKAELVIVPDVPGLISTSEIISRINSKNNTQVSES